MYYMNISTYIALPVLFWHVSASFRTGSPSLKPSESIPNE